MTYGRDLVYGFVNKQVAVERQIKSGSDDDLQLHDLLNRVEDDRAHVEAEKMRARAKAVRLDLLDPFSPYREQMIMGLADLADPYEKRDGQLVRKSDGQPVIL